MGYGLRYSLEARTAVTDPKWGKPVMLTPRLRSRGLTVKTYTLLLEKFEGRCGICKVWGGTSLDIDHCHKTGRVRGLLCNSCNSGIGKLGDDEEGLLKALNHLRTNQESTA